MNGLQKELGQTKTFPTTEEEGYLGLLRTAEVLRGQVNELLRPFELSHSQYNVLRILRGAGESGISASEIYKRLVTNDSDVTKLLDRLEARALATRCRDDKDRRVVTARITEQGLMLLSELDAPVGELHKKQFGDLGAGLLEKLLALLALVRNNDE